MGLSRDELKRLAGYTAVDQTVKSGMKLGLGTGSTAIWAARRVGELLSAGELRDIVAVTTDLGTKTECQDAGIPVRELNDKEIDGHLDLAIDGADEVDPDLYLIKGGGGALTIEKIVDYAAERFIVVTDDKKIVSWLGETFPVPVEVLPAARVRAFRALEACGGRPEMRMATRKSGPVITDNGNIILDVHFERPFDAPKLERELNSIPGVVENGLFTQLIPTVFVARESGTVEEYKGRT